MPARIAPKKQKGVVLFITLIALVILMISGIALTRSTDTALLISGNLAVKRDLTNQAENAIQSALAQFASGGALTTEAARWKNLATANYSATVLPSNAQGVPDILLDTDSNYSAKFANAGPASSNGISYRYVIDRLCLTPGPADMAHCTTGKSLVDPGGDAPSQASRGGSMTGFNERWVYRITVRVTDARQTQSFIQTTMSSYGS